MSIFPSLFTSADSPHERAAGSPRKRKPKIEIASEMSVVPEEFGSPRWKRGLGGTESKLVCPHVAARARGADVAFDVEWWSVVASAGVDARRAGLEVVVAGDPRIDVAVTV